MIGSFGNVVIYRLPLGKSVVSPRSHCYSCKKTVPWYDNIPIFSWFILRGKCRNCKAPYSFRYAFVELLMGALFALAFWYFGFCWFLLEALIFFSMSSFDNKDDRDNTYDICDKLLANYKDNYQQKIENNLSA